MDELSIGDAKCQEYGCQYYGGWECQSTRLLNRHPDAMCIGPVQCSSCYYMGLDGVTRFCSVGDHTASHYCNYMYNSGWKSKKSAF